MGTKCRRVHKEQTSWMIGTSNLKNLFRSFVSLRTTKIWDLCHHTGMNKTNLFSTESLTDLQSFMFDTMLPADDCVDWFCDRHDVNATDEVIDFVVDAHFAFHGEWWQWTLKSQSISQSPRIASTILFTFLMSLVLILLTTKNVMMR